MPASAPALAGQAMEALTETPAGHIQRLLTDQEEKREAFDAGASTWGAWNNLSTTSTSATMDVTWQNWNVTYTGTSGAMLYDANSNAAMLVSTSGSITGYGPQWTVWNTEYEETAEQQAEREAVQRRRLQEQRDAEWQARAEERRIEREKANARARELLRLLLSDEQWASYQENGWFEVRGSRGGRWRIRDRGQSGNVDLMPEIGEERDVTYCAHPPGSLPDADAHVAQMLALVTDEEAFTRTANVHYRRTGAAPPFMQAVA